MVYVYENQQYRWLSFDDNFIQTVIDKKNPSNPQLSYIASMCCLLKNTRESILILGACGGGAIHYISKHFPNLAVTAIEINSYIIEFSKRFFFLTHPVIQADAFDYLKTAPVSDYLLIDLFVHNCLPNTLAEPTFYHLCKQKVNHSISINLLCHDYMKALEIIRIIRDVFDNRTLCLTINKRKNLVVHAFKGEAFLKEIQLLHQQGLIQRPLWNREFGMMSKVEQ